MNRRNEIGFALGVMAAFAILPMAGAAADYTFTGGAGTGDLSFRLYDMMGNELPVPSDRTMILTERPVYVVER